MPTINCKTMTPDEVNQFLSGELDLALEDDEEVVLLDKHGIDTFIHKCCSCGLLHEILIERLRNGWSIRFRNIDSEELLERDVVSCKNLQARV